MVDTPKPNVFPSPPVVTKPVMSPAAAAIAAQTPTVKTPQQLEREAKLKEVNEKKDKEKKELLKVMDDAITEYNGESNIPVSHIYWDSVNRYRVLNAS